MIERFLTYLRCEVNYSPHTVAAYRSDLFQLASWLTGDKPENFDAASVTHADIRSWLGHMARQGTGPRSLRRKLLSVRSFYRFLRKTGLAATNPASSVELPKIPKPLPHFVSENDMEQIVGPDAFDTDDVEEYRDKLIIDILYSTGIRRSELLGLRDCDILLNSYEIKVNGKRRLPVLVNITVPFNHGGDISPAHQKDGNLLFLLRLKFYGEIFRCPGKLYHRIIIFSFRQYPAAAAYNSCFLYFLI